MRHAGIQIHRAFPQEGVGQIHTAAGNIPAAGRNRISAVQIVIFYMNVFDMNMADILGVASKKVGGRTVGVQTVSRVAADPDGMPP